MNHFISFKEKISCICNHVIKVATFHGKWINTLSYLENCGARKIASCEDPTAVKEEMLKHAAEEFRHAFYLKKQLKRINQDYEDYCKKYLLGGWAALHYLNLLDVKSSQYFRSINMSMDAIKRHAYCFVTYAIELRAEELYPIYNKALKMHQSKIQVQSILLEEKEHLQEMQMKIASINNASIILKVICEMEASLFEKWLLACEKELYANDVPSLGHNVLNLFSQYPPSQFSKDR